MILQSDHSLCSQGEKYFMDWRMKAILLHSVEFNYIENKDNLIKFDSHYWLQLKCENWKAMYH